MARIAILHYTALPSVGGVELLVEHQIEALTSLGHQVRLVVGTGDTPGNSDVILVPGLVPKSRRPETYPLSSQTADADQDVSERALRAALSVALDDCDECWIHNLLTLTLHPAASAALHRLVRERPRIRWVAWCEDLSATSGYVSAADVDALNGFKEHLPGVSYVTISDVRRRELATVLSLPAEEIRVVHPPVHPVRWLGLGGETVELLERLPLQIGHPLVLVPSKVLPHKNLGLVVSVSDRLREQSRVVRVLITGAISPHEPLRSGELLRELKQEVEARSLANTVFFVGDELGHPAVHSTVRDLMLLADVVFLPSTEEGYGMAISESLVLRTPVLCADISAFRESGNGTPSYFALSDDPSAIASRILSICDLPANRSRRAGLRSYAQFRLDIAALVARTPTGPCPGGYDSDGAPAINRQKV